MPWGRQAVRIKTRPNKLSSLISIQTVSKCHQTLPGKKLQKFADDKIIQKYSACRVNWLNYTSGVGGLNLLFLNQAEMNIKDKMNFPWK